MADESKNGVEAPRAGAAAATSVAASGFYTLAIGSPVMVQFPLETGGVKWKQGHVVEWDAGYTVMYGDGTHGLLQEDAVFTVQRVSRATKVAPGMPVLAPVNAETTTEFFSAIIADVDLDTGMAQVVFGEHGKQWQWVKDADQEGAQVRHYLGFQATLQPLVAPRPVPVAYLYGSLQWLRYELISGGVIRVHPSVLYKGDNLSMRMDVPDSQGSPDSPGPLLTGAAVLRSVATMFDVDHDGGLTVQEYNAMVSSACGPSGTKDYVPEEAEDIPKRIKKWHATPETISRMARSVGYTIPDDGSIPLDAVPALWEVCATTRATQLRTRHQPKNANAAQLGRDRLLLELANVTLVRYGRGMKPAQVLDALDVHPPAVKNESMNNVLYALPKLYVAAGTATAIAASAAAVGFAKEAATWDVSPPAGLMESIKAALQSAVMNAPHVVAAFMEACVGAWQSAPEHMAAFKEQLLGAVNGAREALQAAGAGAHAALLASSHLAAQLVDACKEAVRHGAAISSTTIAKLRGFFASGGNESPPPSESGGAMAAVGDAVSDVKAALRSAVAFFGTYCNRATLEELQQLAESLPQAVTNALPALGQVTEALRSSVDRAVAELPDLGVNAAEVAAAAGAAAASVKDELASAVTEGADTVASLSVAAATAAASVPSAAARALRSMESVDRLFRIAAAQGADVAEDAVAAIKSALQTGEDTITPMSAEVTALIKGVATHVNPSVLAEAMAAVRSAAESFPAAAALHAAVNAGVAASGATASLLADSSAVEILGGAAEAGKVVASSVTSLMASAVEAGADVSDAAAAQIVAAANDAAAAVSVAAAEGQEAACHAAHNAAQAAADLPDAPKEAARVAWVLAQSGAAHARAVAASTRRAGLVALREVGALVDDLDTKAAVATVVEASAAAEAAAARSTAMAVLSGVDATSAAMRRVLASAHAVAVVAASATADTWTDLVSSDAVATAAAAGADAAAQSAQALSAAADAVAGSVAPEIAEAARASVAAAMEARLQVAPALSAGAAIAAATARSVAACSAIGVEVAAAGVSQGITAAMEALPDDAASQMHLVLSAGVNTGALFLQQVAEVSQEAAASAIDAGRRLAPLLPKLATVAAAAASASATAAAAAAGTLSDAAGHVAEVMGPAAIEAGEALGTAASTAADLASVGADAAGVAAMNAGAAIGSAAASAGGVVVGLAGAGFEEAKEAAGAAYVAGQKFWDSALAKGSDIVTWETVGDVYDLSSEALLNLSIAAVAVAGSCIACTQSNCFGCDTIKLSIVRDFFQMLGLFFASMASRALELASALWGKLANLISFDFNFVAPSINPLVVYILIGVVAFILLVCFAVFMCMASSKQPDALRQGHEAELWDEQAEKYKKTVKFLRFFLTGCFSVYLPVSRTVFQILVCEATMGRMLERVGLNLGCVLLDTDIASDSYECSCSDWAEYIYLQIAAVFLLIFFTLALPVRCYMLIRANKPKGSREDPGMRYDEDGQLVEYTDHMYNMDLMTDPAQLKCPYLFLYKGYERRWAYYQVLVMIFKFIICIPVIIFWNNTMIQTLLTLLLLAMYCGFTFYSTPFINPQADGMDASARLTATLTVAFALLGSEDVFSSASGFFAILVHVTNGINILAIIGFTLYGFPKCKRKIKNAIGQLEFTDTCINESGPAHKIVPAWDLERECKHRVWHAFWNSLVVNTCSPEVQERFASLKKRVSDVGKHRVAAYFQALERNPVRLQQYRWVESNLEGVDVYFDGIPLDGHLDSKTKFCKMYINPFPFEVVLAYDDSDDVNMLYEKDFDKFVEQNRNPDIVSRRNNRRIMRGLALTKHAVHNPFTRTEHHSVPDGTETYTDSEGNTHTRTRYTTVPVQMTYTNGVMHVSAKTDKEYSRGFGANLRYTDGHGIAVAPHTGQHHTIHNSYTMGMGEFGVDSTLFRGSAKWQGICSRNASAVHEGLARLEEKDRAYRHKLMSKRRADEKVLNSSFWFYVYDNEEAMYDREKLETYLRQSTYNEEISSIPTKHRAGLDFLYGRVNWVHTHPCSKLWWVFFDDVWQNNKDLNVFQANPDACKYFDTRSSDSVAYHPVPRDELEAKLEELGLRNLPGCRGSKKYFNDRVLDILYTKMDELDELVRVGSELPRAVPDGSV